MVVTRLRRQQHHLHNSHSTINNNHSNHQHSHTSITGKSPAAAASGSFDLLATQPSTRIYLTSPNGVPSVVFSVIRYEDEKQMVARKKRYLHTSNSAHYQGAATDHLHPGGTSLDSLATKRRATTGESYQRFLLPSPVGLYNPLALDDPELRTGKHRTVITLPSYMVSNLTALSRLYKIVY